MLTLIQFPWSPLCITIRHILKRHHIPFKLHNIAFQDRAPVITATKGAGYTVPCRVNGKRGICDVTDLGFVDTNLYYGVLENYLFNGKTKLPSLKHLRRWHRTMKQPD